MPDRPRNDPPTFWNGEPTPCERGTAVVADTPEFPQYWARSEPGLIGSRIKVVKVTYYGDVSYMDDRDGSGWRKVTEGHGGPRYGHRNISIVAGSFGVVS